MIVTDRSDDYYQPWLRDPAVGPDKSGSAPPSEGLAKPPAGPPLGVDVSAYPLDDAASPRQAAEPAQAQPEGPTALDRVRGGARGFANWTIKAGERADIPARVERLELPRRAAAFAAGSAAATTRAGKAMGRGAASGWTSLSQMTARGWTRMALGDHVGKIAESAKSGIESAADKTRSTVGSAAKAGIAGVSEATGKAKGKLRSKTPAEPAPPPSGLDQLLEREAAEKPRKAAPDLPLFAVDAVPSTVDAPKPVAEQTPAKPATNLAAKSVPPPPAPAGPPRATSAGASSWPAALASPWWIAGGALALAATFWLGTRTGASRSDIETAVSEYILSHPEIIPQAMEKYRANEIAKSIDAIRPGLEKSYAGAWAGNAKGDVTVTVFTDYGCVFCRASVPDIDRLVREDSGVKIVYRELPIIAPQSRDAAIMALRAARQGKYDAFHHAMFAAGSLEKSAIAAAAAKAGLVTDGSADATGSAAVLQREIDSNLAMAQQLQLNATPTWIIGDQLLQGALGYDGLTAAVATARGAKG